MSYPNDSFADLSSFVFRHVSCIYFAMHLSLVAGFSIDGLLEALVFTQATETPYNSLRRYVRTAYHIYLWLTEDVFDETSDAFKSIDLVRKMHANVAKRMNRENSGKAHVSQYDMAIVQSGFFAAVFMYPKHFGIYCTQAELEDYAYAWRVIGYMLGIEDQYNICSGTYEEIYATCKDIEQQVLVPHMRNPPPSFDSIADAYIEGVNLPSNWKIQSKASVLAYVWYCFDLPNPQKLSWTDTARYYVLRAYISIISWCPGFESFINKQVHASLIRFGNTKIVEDIKKNKKE